MSVFKRKKHYYEIGKNSSADKLLQALHQAKTGDTQDALVDGAIQAFRENRPENVQTVLLNVKTINDHFYPRKLASSTLFDVSEGSADKLASINLALAKLPENEKKEVLSKALYGALQRREGGEPFLALLLEAGADANATVNDYKGSILVAAICNRHPMSVIKLLHDNGASFKDALTTMYSRSYNTDDKDTLRHFQEELEGKPAAADALPTAEEALPVMAQVMRQMLEQVSELTARVGELTDEVKNLKSSDAGQPANKIQTRTPSIKILRQ